MMDDNNVIQMLYPQMPPFPKQDIIMVMEVAL